MENRTNKCPQCGADFAEERGEGMAFKCGSFLHHDGSLKESAVCSLLSEVLLMTRTQSVIQEKSDDE